LRFLEASQVEQVAPGLYTGEAFPDWDIFGVANGGYLLAIAARAMGHEVEGRDLVSVSGRFINPASAGPLRIEVEHLKSGRSVSTLQATMSSDGRPLLTASASFALASEEHHKPPTLIDSDPPELPPVDECVLLVPSSDSPLPPPFAGQVECHLHPDDLGYFGTTNRRSPLMRGWFRLRYTEPIDPYGMVVGSDAFPPAVFNSGLPIGWTPTVDLTVHVRDPGPHQWLKCKMTTRFITEGWLDEDGELWDVDDNLVAQSRQLALLSRQ
jgi:acyl-CoA thioesterase